MTLQVDWLLWLKCQIWGHLSAYDHNGPPIHGISGPWYICIRCGSLHRYNVGGHRLVTKRDYNERPF